MVALAMEVMCYVAVAVIRFVFISTFPPRWLSLAVDRAMTVVVAIETLCDLELWHESVSYIVGAVYIKTMVDEIFAAF